MEEPIKLSNEEIVARFKKEDRWRLEDIILLAFGYEHKGVDWDYLVNTNSFPVRQHGTALKATNSIQASKRLDYISKKDVEVGLCECYVKKGDFIKWANNQWGKQEPRVKEVFNLWEKYKKASGTSSPSKQTTKAKVATLANKIQISQYIECRKNNKNYKNTIIALAKHIAKNHTYIEGKYNSFRTYIKLMKVEELEKEYQAVKQNSDN